MKVEQDNKLQVVVSHLRVSSFQKRERVSCRLIFRINTDYTYEFRKTRNSISLEEKDKSKEGAYNCTKLLSSLIIVDLLRSTD